MFCFRLKFSMSCFHLICFEVPRFQKKSGFWKLVRVCDCKVNIERFASTKLIKIKSPNFVHTTRLVHRYFQVLTKIGKPERGWEDRKWISQTTLKIFFKFDKRLFACFLECISRLQHKAKSKFGNPILDFGSTCLKKSTRMIFFKQNYIFDVF